MPKDNIALTIISSRLASIFFGISIVLTGAAYFLYAKQTIPLLPGFLPKKNICVYLTGTAFILGGFAIIMNKKITTLACYLLIVLLFCVTVAIDLRGFFNIQDELRNVYLQSLLKDVGLIAGAMIIANFEREHKHRRGRHRIKSRSEVTL
jgi:uncharacterized membrane protein